MSAIFFTCLSDRVSAETFFITQPVGTSISSRPLELWKWLIIPVSSLYRFSSSLDPLRCPYHRNPAATFFSVPRHRPPLHNVRMCSVKTYGMGQLSLGTPMTGTGRSLRTETRWGKDALHVLSAPLIEYIRRNMVFPNPDYRPLQPARNAKPKQPGEERNDDWLLPSRFFGPNTPSAGSNSQVEESSRFVSRLSASASSGSSSFERFVVLKEKRRAESVSSDSADRSSGHEWSKGMSSESGKE